MNLSFKISCDYEDKYGGEMHWEEEIGGDAQQ